MGFENRDYAKDSSYSSYGGGYGLKATGVVKKIVIVTGVIFLLQVLTMSSDTALVEVPDPGAEASADGRQAPQRRVVPVKTQSEPITEIFAFNGEDIVYRGQVWRLLTYAFLHSTSDPLHLIFNMLVLWTLGRAVEELCGSREFLWFYMVSAVFAAIFYLAFWFGLKLMRPVGLGSMLGASGAVGSCLALYALHYPRRKISLFGVFDLEARVLIGGLLVLDGLGLLARVAEVSNSRTAHASHLGGALFAYIYFKRQMRLSSITKGFNFGSVKRTVKAKRSDLKIYAPETGPRSKDSIATETVDAILAKISEQGEESLTDSERETLTRASKQYRDR